MKFLRICCLMALVSSSAMADYQDDLVVYFPLDETSGTQARSTTGDIAEYNPSAGTPHWDQADPGVKFYLGGQTYFSTAPEIGNGLTNGLTVSAFVKLDSYGGYVTIATKGHSGAVWEFYLNGEPASLALGTNFNLSGYQHWETPGLMSIDTWYHVAATYDGSNVRFYIDGIKVHEVDATINFANLNEGIQIGRLAAGIGSFKGDIANLAVYHRALSDNEIEGLGASAEKLSADYTGLWLGRAALDEVKEVRTDTWGAAPAPFYETVLLHVDAGGTPRLLSEAILMQTRVTPPDLPETVVISDVLQVSQFDGITRRGGKLIGQRFSSATTAFDEQSLSFFRDGDQFSTGWNTPAASPLNPFRHKYHPDLKNGFEIGRTLSFTLPSEDSPTDNEVTGVFTETIEGLNKDTLEARGSIIFTRVSTSGLLNPAP